MPETATRGSRKTTEGVRLPYMPGLDGLRALAVVAVLLYHAGLPWIPGGFLGVDVFFVISGYLITSLLLAEWRARGHVDLKAFWLGRARRLLPAAFLVIVVSLAFAVFFLPGEVAGLRGDALASFGYVTNWHLILEHESYFEAVGRPSLLRHLWSLAVEEQFYVVWPLLLASGLGMGALRYRRRRLLFAVLAGAATSALLMALLYRPEADPSRVYYGTDTRAAGLLVGAALAFLWAPRRAPRRVLGRAGAPEERYRTHRTRRAGRFRRRWGWTGPALLDALGLAALSALVWSCLNLGEYQPFLYRGGFALVAVTTAVLIAAVVYPRGCLGTVLLAWGPLRWVGLRSYGIYLWHWPVFMVTRPHLDVPLDGLPLLLGRLAVTVAVADLSYRYVEKPIRKGALGRTFQALREARGARRWELGARAAGTIVPVLVGCVALGLAVAQAQPPKPPSYLSTTAVHTEIPADKQAIDQTPRPDSAQKLEDSKGETTAPTAAPGVPPDPPRASAMPEKKEAPAATAANNAAPTTVGPVTAIGDSVMLGTIEALEQDIPNLQVIDAQVGLQVSDGIYILQQRRAAGQLGDVVIVHLGNNGTFTAEQFDEMMGVLSGVRRVVFVNDKVPLQWEESNDQVIADGVRRYPEQAMLVDWRAASVNQPELFWDDGIHLRPEGAQFYAQVIASRLEGR